MAAKHRAGCISLRPRMKDGIVEDEGMFEGRDHDLFPAFMHSTENTTGVGACVHAQYWGMVRHPRTIDTHYWQREPCMFFSLLADFGCLWGDIGRFAGFGCLGAAFVFDPDRYPDTFVSNCINELLY
jgi:hypothetical protein